MKRPAVGEVIRTHNKLKLILQCAVVFCAALILMIGSVQTTKAALFNVTTTADNVPGSLRQAITDANATTAADTINFTGAGIGTHTPLSPLPTITQPLIINGYTGTAATAANGNTPATLVVEISGASAGGSGSGLQFASASCTTGNCRVLGLVINRFEDAGIRITSGSVSVFGNFIGTDIGGTSNLCGSPQVLCGNVNRGIAIVGSTGSAIGNSTVANRNVISANSGTGISITGGGAATVAGNFIGTDKNGTADLGNTQDGVRIVNSSSSVIGGSSSSSGNVISGNDGSGVAIIQDGSRDVSNNVIPAANNVISANFIGVDVTGNAATIIGGFSTSAVGNSGSGVLINAAGNRVGGIRTTTAMSSTCVSECNVIAGNRANGVSLGTNFATGNTISGNNIGIGVTATNTNGNAIGNRDNGVQISGLAADNNIGGTSTPGFCNNGCNVIANNGATDATSARAGIYADPTAATRNRIRVNSIFANGGIGIDLDTTGTTANDANDPDTGANNLQNFPTFTASDTNGTITGTLNSLPNTTFVIDFYRNDTADTQIASEARTYIGSVRAITNAGGNAAINFGSLQTLAAGQFVTATATNVSSSNGDTSEISAAQSVIAATTQAPAGMESDVAPRPNGDGAIGSTDTNQVERFQIQLDTFQSNEFQRADAAPANTRGDGVINSADTNQAERYQIGLDTRQSAGGSASAGSPRSVFESDGSKPDVIETVAAPRELRVQNTTGSANQSVTVNLLVDTFGDESGYGFTLNYNNAVLLNPSVAIGTEGGTRLCNLMNAGQIICSVRNFPNNNPASAEPQINEISAGNGLVLVRVTFTVASNAQPGTTPLTITSVDATNDLSQPLTITTPAGGGTVTIAGPTAAPVSISGRLVSASGAGIGRATVKLFDTASGQTYNALTGADGAYVFEGVAVGGDYIVTPAALGYTFNPKSKFFSLVEDLTAVDFVGVRGRKRNL